MSEPIANPVINGPYDEPKLHFKFDDDGITNETVVGRRPSEYFIPVPQSRKRNGSHQEAFDFEWTADRRKSNDLVNEIRGYVQVWRLQGYPNVTPTTRRLLEYWADPLRDNRVLFAQREAAETAVFLAEAAQKAGRGPILNHLEAINDDFNDGLPRVALKMATGSGKTVVMAMLIAWHVLNKTAAPQDKRFSRRFLVITPGVTIRDRLTVLKPTADGNYYRARDLIPPDLWPSLLQAEIFITNFHTFLPKVTREGAGLAKATKDLLLGGGQGGSDPFLESPQQVATRVAREFGLKTGEIIVFNDEGHHCYREKPIDDEDVLDADERAEVEERAEQARVWFRGLQALRVKLGIKAVYDLSATPFFLGGSGYGAGTLFPWVVSDFSLIDAVECGIVKVPRLPVDDDAEGDRVVYRHLWDEIAQGDVQLPKRTARTARTRSDDPHLPKPLEGALWTLYASYEKAFAQWRAIGEELGETPPVFIVVCNNTAVSKLVFDWIAGFEKETTSDNGEVVVGSRPGNLGLFSNVVEGAFTDRPRTILVDSVQLESGQQLSDEFKKLAALEIEEFKNDLRVRFPGRDPDTMTEADLLREVMNTVGKRGRLGAEIRCVVSVAMLTEGWDANTVTHILGVRPFRTPLLTEQVVGRGLRRRSYEVNEDGLFEPEYAEVFGVPFAFLPTAPSKEKGTPQRAPIRVRAVAERAKYRITFPRLLGYRLELPDPDFVAHFNKEECRLTLDRHLIPIKVHVGDITGYDEVVYPEYLRQIREQEVAFRLAKRLLEREWLDRADRLRPWMFPKVLRIARQWMREAVTYEPGTYPGLLLLSDVTEQAVERMLKGLVEGEGGQERVLPVFEAEREGSTDWVGFETTRRAHRLEVERCHLNYLVEDSSWEWTVAQALDSITEVEAWVKNDHLDFTIPYTWEGRAARYTPDFLARLTPDSKGIPRTLIVEVSGGGKRYHSPGTVREKTDTARHLWCPAVNGYRGWGRWWFLEVHDPGAARSEILRAVDAV